MLRVATWNIWWRHGDWAARRPAIIAELTELDADVVGLQEVSSRRPDQREWLGELGYEVVSAPGDGDRHGQVNAIASRLPIVDHGWEYLDVGDLPPHRTVLWADLELSPGSTVTVYCTHLSHAFDQSALRSRQLDQIAAIVAARRADPTDGHPPILLGDLNAAPDSDEMRRATGLAPPPVTGLVFTDSWAQVGPGGGITYAAANPHVVDSAWPDRRLDYVLVAWPRPRPLGNPLRASLFGTSPRDGIVPSDHYGVVVDLAGDGRTGR